MGACVIEPYVMSPATEEALFLPDSFRLCKERQRDLQNLGHLARIRLKERWDADDANDGRDDESCWRYVVIEKTDGCDRRRLQSNLFLRLPEGSVDDGVITLFNTAAGKRDLSFVRLHIICPPGKKEVDAPLPHQERQKDSGTPKPFDTDFGPVERIKNVLKRSCKGKVIHQRNI